jgi:predicted molibdopterin-dependent oxidoreductase YjgC
VVGLATVFGAGGGTSSYAEARDADVIVMWGSNARNAHPIYFHHVLQAMRRGAKLFVIDPRRTETAQFADRWLGLEVGTDIALSNTVAREIIDAGLVHHDFVERATSGFDEFAAAVEPWTLERGSEVTGVPPDAIRELAHAYATARAAQLCWTLGITEHHNGVDNVLSLCNLALLAGQVGRYGAGLSPLRGQNNVQGGGDMGALPDRLPGFQRVDDDVARARFEAEWGATVPPTPGRNLTQMFDAMEHGELRSLLVVGENPAQSEADVSRAVELLRGLDHLVVLDIHRTGTAELADVVLPGSASWCESNGTVTNSERRVQRVRKALDPPGEARDDIDILVELARRLGHDWTYDTHEDIWNEVRRLSPMHAGMSWARLEATGGLQWPCPSEDSVEPSFLHGRLWADDPAARGRRAPFSVVAHEPPAEAVTAEFPLRLTTGRRLDSYNTGVQSGGYRSPNRRGESVDVSPADARSLDLSDGELVRVTSPRGTVEAPVRIDRGLRAGLVFMTFHFPDEVDVNRLTIDATDPKSGTAEFKAAAVRIEKIETAEHPTTNEWTVTS